MRLEHPDRRVNTPPNACADQPCEVWGETVCAIGPGATRQPFWYVVYHGGADLVWNESECPPSETCSSQNTCVNPLNTSTTCNAQANGQVKCMPEGSILKCVYTGWGWSWLEEEHCPTEGHVCLMDQCFEPVGGTPPEPESGCLIEDSKMMEFCLSEDDQGDRLLRGLLSGATGGSVCANTDDHTVLHCTLADVAAEICPLARCVSRRESGPQSVTDGSNPGGEVCAVHEGPWTRAPEAVRDLRRRLCRRRDLRSRDRSGREGDVRLRGELPQRHRVRPRPEPLC